MPTGGPVTFPKAGKTEQGAAEDNRVSLRCSQCRAPWPADGSPSTTPSALLGCGLGTWQGDLALLGECCRGTGERLLCLESTAAELFPPGHIPEAPSWDMGRCSRAIAPHPAVTRHRAAKLPLAPTASLMALPAKTACQAAPRTWCWAQSQHCQSIPHCQPYLGAVLTMG